MAAWMWEARHTERPAPPARTKLPKGSTNSLESWNVVLAQACSSLSTRCLIQQEIPQDDSIEFALQKEIGCYCFKRVHRLLRRSGLNH